MKGVTVFACLVSLGLCVDVYTVAFDGEKTLLKTIDSDSGAVTTIGEVPVPIGLYTPGVKSSELAYIGPNQTVVTVTLSPFAVSGAVLSDPDVGVFMVSEPPNGGQGQYAASNASQFTYGYIDLGSGDIGGQFASSFPATGLSASLFDSSNNVFYVAASDGIIKFTVNPSFKALAPNFHVDTMGFHWRSNGFRGVVREGTGNYSFAQITFIGDNALLKPLLELDATFGGCLSSAATHKSTGALYALCSAAGETELKLYTFAMDGSSATSVSLSVLDKSYSWLTTLNP